MVLLAERLGLSLKFSSKLENHTNSPGALPASLQAFQSDVSDCLNQLLLSLKSGPGSLSLRWIQQCFEAIPFVKRAFAKLLADIDYPTSKWEGDSIEDYLKYSLRLLELLNSINSSVSHLADARLSLNHALSLIDNSPSLALERLRKFQARAQIKNLKVGGFDVSKAGVFSGKERVVLQALMEMKGISLWVCGILLSSLCSDTELYMEIRKINPLLSGSSSSSSSSLKALDLGVLKELSEKERDFVKEVREMNEAVGCLVEAIARGKCNGQVKGLLQRKVEILEEVLDGIGKRADHLFSEVLAGRSKLLDSLRHQKQ